MIRQFSFNFLACPICLVISQVTLAPEVSARELKVLSEQTATGFGHVESVADDPHGKVLYTSDFGPDSLSRRIRTAKARSPKYRGTEKSLRMAFARQAADAKQAEGYLDQGQSVLDHRHRLGLGI
jgi:hypothetical protein